MNQYVKAFVLTLLLPGIPCVLFVLVVYLFTPRATFDCGFRRTIELTQPFEIDSPAPALWYEVFENGNCVSKGYTHVHGEDYWDRPDQQSIHELRIKLVLSKDGRIAGLISEKFPYTLFVIHDFTTNLSLPRDGSEFVEHQGRLKLQQLIEALEENNPGISFREKVKDREYFLRKYQLDFSYTKFDDALVDHVSDLPRLDYLGLNHTNITDAGLKRLSGAPGALNLSDTNVTDEGIVCLAKHPRLRILNLSGTKVTDAAMVHLAGAKQLERVFLQNTRVTDKGRDALKKALPKVVIE